MAMFSRLARIGGVVKVKNALAYDSHGSAATAEYQRVRRSWGWLCRLGGSFATGVGVNGLGLQALELEVFRLRRVWYCC